MKSIKFRNDMKITFYFIIRPMKYHVFENIMENGAFGSNEQLLHFL